MRSRRRWVGVAALCVVAVVPEAHAQVGSSAQAGVQPAAAAADLPAAMPAAAVAQAGAAVTRASRLEALNQQVVSANLAALTLGGAARPGAVGSAAGRSAAVSSASSAAGRPAGARPASAPGQAVATKVIKTKVIKTKVIKTKVIKTNGARASGVNTTGVKTTVIKTGDTPATAPKAAAPMTALVARAQGAVTRATRLDSVTQQAVGANLAALRLAGGFTGGNAAPALIGQAAAAAVGLPKSVVVRQPARNFGSGYLSSYASLNHRTSSARGFVAAAKDPNGCLVVGDSIGARTASYLDVLAKEQFGQGCAYEVWNGRPTEGAVNALEHIAKTHGLPKRVVVISGANDIFNPPEFRAQVERAAKIVGPNRTLTWSSVFVRRPLTGTAAADLENSRWLNILLSRAAAKHPNIRVVNWYGFLAERQRRLSTYLLDGVHPTPAGRKALAELIAAKW